VNRSDAEIADVPLGVVTVTSMVSAPCGGATAMICVSELMLNELDCTVPNATAVAPAKLLPVMVTTAPPAVLPDEGLMPVTTGADAAT
jgi:hypothetical protein